MKTIDRSFGGVINGTPIYSYKTVEISGQEDFNALTQWGKEFLLTNYPFVVSDDTMNCKWGSIPRTKYDGGGITIRVEGKPNYTNPYLAMRMENKEIIARTGRDWDDGEWAEWLDRITFTKL